MSKDTDIDWADDLFDGDIDFNDDFESMEKKGFVSGLTSGFISGLIDNTVGSSAAINRTLRSVLPSSYSTFFDKVEYFKVIKDELVQEFKEENYQNVKSLQNIAKQIGQKIDNENNIVRKQLEGFSENDFSSWEGYKSSTSDENPTYEDDSYENFSEDVNRLIQAQQEAMATSTAGLNEMSAQVGGTIVAAIKTGNRGLLGLESGMRDLLNYQRNVQYKMDKTMIELTAKNYVLDARFYKFSEKANHRIIDELKKITANSAKSDFQKTTLLEQTKAQARSSILGVVGRRTTGFLGKLRERFSESNRKEAYSNIGELLGAAEAALEGGGGGMNSGAIGEGIGNLIASMVASSIPNLMREGPFRELADTAFGGLDPKTQQRLRSGWGKVRNYGNVASYLSTNGGGLLNYVSQNWRDLDTQQFYDYDDYVEYAKENKLRVLPKALYYAYYKGGDFVRGGINNAMNSMSDYSRGRQYQLPNRDSSKLTSVAQWREINNITLVDVIPGWLSKIYESQERMRTGNDGFRAPVFSYARGQFMDKATATKIVKKDIFRHDAFSTAASEAKAIVGQIDTDGILTDEQAGEFALRIAMNADREYGFNPYQYTGEIEGLDPKLQGIINKLVRNRFGIDDARIRKHEESTGFGKITDVLSLIQGGAGDNLNTLGSLADSLKNTIPNIADNITANREAGNENLLRELGLIKNVNGSDQIDTQLIWDRLREYLVNGNNPQLNSNFVETSLSDAGKTRAYGNGNYRTVNKTVNNTTTGDTGALSDSIETLTETVREQISKMDFSNIKFDLEGIPDKFDTLNKTAEEQRSLLSKIAECTCRTADGWGSKTATEKEKINREEKEGKKTLLERIKEFSPKGFFNKSIETLANNSPLVLTGLAAGLAGYAFKDPKTAAILAGGVGVGYLYGKLRNMAEGSEPSDDENIYNENGDVLLYASKLRNGDYWDTISKAVLTTWKDIKGAVLDIVNRTYVTLSELTGKLFGPDNRRRFLSGLSKVKDFAKSVWNKIDISGTFGKITDAAKNAVYQQDVYVAGDSEPRLTRRGFKDKRYYCLDPSSKEPFVLNGWNDIKGPVYELDSTDTLTQIISEGEIAQGLMTSSGLKLDTLKKGLNWAGSNFAEGLSRFGAFAKEKAGVGAKKVNDMVKADYSPINSRLDRIYYLLCDEFGRPAQPLPSDGIDPSGPAPQEPSKNAGIFGSAFKPKEEAGVKSAYSKESDYPHKVRLNSLEDQGIKEEEAKRDAFYEDVHSIKENMEANSGDSKDPKKKKGLFGMIATILGAGAGIIKKLFTNPLGLIADGIGLVIKSILRSPLRLVKLGSLLFKGVLGVASPIFKLMRWGFTGILGALGRGAMGLLDGVLPGGGKRKRRRAAKTRLKRMKSGGRRPRTKMRGRGLIPAALGAGLSFLPFMSRADEGDGYDDDGYDENLTEGGQYDDDYTTSDRADETGNLYSDDNSDGVADSLVNTAYGAEQGLYLTGAGIGGAGALANRLAPGASEALAGTKYAGGALKGLGAAGKLATGIAGKMFLPLTALQAGMSFFDNDAVSDIFNTNVINGTQRASNAITDVLDLGGLVSGGTKLIGDALGFDTSKLDGAATRFVNGMLDNKLTNWLTDLPGASFIPFVGLLKGLKNYQTDLSSTQRKIRMAMYGINDTKAPLAMVLENVERQLLPYIKIDQGYVTISDNAPLGQIVQNLTKTNVAEAAVWVKQRFLPIYKLWLSAGNLLGYQSLDEIDKDKRPMVIKLVNQVESAVVQFTPYPYDIDPIIAKEYPIMGRAPTEALLAELNKQIQTEFKAEGVDEEGNIDSKVVIRTAEEVKEGKPESDGWFDQASAWLNSKFTKLSLMGFEEPKDVIAIDISDLHPGDGKPMDELTMVRLGAYGNTESSPVKVDAVLKLERYCEQFFTVRSGTPMFSKEPKEILAIFKNTFQLVPAWFENWEKWFANRFLPVLKTWVREVYNLRSKMPKDAWTSLSATNRSDIGHALIGVKVEVKGEAVDVWDVEEGPFFGTTSGTEVSAVRKYVNALDAKRAEQVLKDPTAEAVASQGNNQIKPMTDEEKYALYHGGKKANFSMDAGAAAYTKSKGNSDLDRLIEQGSPGTTNSATGNYNESIMPGSDSGAYAPVNATGDDNYTPDTTVKGEGFKISPREAKKTILNEFIKAGVTDPRVLAFAIANAEVETSLQGRVEDLSYQPSALLGSFSSFMREPDLAYKYGYIPGKQKANQAMIARIAYGRGKKAKELGNRNEEDGQRFIGRGFTQLTGRSNYATIGKEIGEDLVNSPELVSKDPKTAAKTEYAFFDKNGIISKLKSGNLAGAVSKVGRDIHGSHAKKIGLTNKYIQELQSGELKNLVNELNMTSKGEGDAENTETAAAADATTNSLNGLDGTNKVNVPTDANADGETAPITTPAVSASEAQPASTDTAPVADEPAGGATNTAEASAPQQTPAPAQTRVEKPVAVEESKQKAPEPKEPQMTPVYDGAVVGAIDRLTKSLESVLSQSKRVSVGNRNLTT